MNCAAYFPSSSTVCLLSGHDVRPLNSETGPPADAPFSKAQVHQLLSATKYEQVSVLMDWLWRQVIDPFLARCALLKRLPIISLMVYERFPSFDEPHRFNTNVYETLIEILSAARVYAVIFEVGLKTVLTFSRLTHVIAERYPSLKTST